MYKTIFIDVEGTLKNSKGEITQRTVASIQKLVAVGMRVILVSEESREQTLAIRKACGASCYVISSNGAEVFDNGIEKVIYEDVMNRQEVCSLYHLAVAYGASYKIGSGSLEKKIEVQEEIKGIEVISSFLEKSVVQYCSFEIEGQEKWLEIEEKIHSLSGVKIVQSTEDIALPLKRMVVPSYTSKGNAMVELCRKIPVSLDETIAIGDSENDISMFKMAAQSVAMGNAKEEIKRLADRTIARNEEEGVAIFLEEIWQRYQQGAFF